jgi:hypothetical protein
MPDPDADANHLLDQKIYSTKAWRVAERTERKATR